MPDRIFIFQEPLERLARGEDVLTARIRQTVIHARMVAASGTFEVASEILDAGVAAASRVQAP